MTTFEQATRVALIVSAPHLAQNQKSYSLVEHVDVFPTICDLASLPIPSFCQGTSLKPILSNAASRSKKASMSQVLHDGEMGWALRTNRYRYVEWRKFNEDMGKAGISSEVVATELYDYETDPLELINHSSQSDYAQVLRDHQTLFDQLLPYVPKRTYISGN
jgi:arylsulfatase A-like enzyme